MRIIINGTETNIPSSLQEITLGQRIDFQEQHGNQLDEMAKSIAEMPDGPLKELEELEFIFEKMFRSFSFFSGFSVESLKESEFLDTIANVYYSSLKLLFEQEAELELEKSFVWNHEVWHLAPPELKYGDKMKFGELIDAKQTVQDLMEFGANKWEYLIPLCAVYLRKHNEPYKKEFLFEGSERMVLMKGLPMNIALQVGFFLSSTQNIYMNTLRFSNQPGLRNPENIHGNTSSGLDG